MIFMSVYLLAEAKGADTLHISTVKYGEAIPAAVISTFPDPQSQFGISDVLKIQPQSWQSLKPYMPQAAVWYKLIIHADDNIPEQLLLNIDARSIRELQMYLILKGKPHYLGTSGIDLPFWMKNFRQPDYLFPIPRNQESVIFYFRTKQGSVNAKSISIQKLPNTFFLFGRNSYHAGLFYGILLSVLLITSILHITLFKKEYWSLSFLVLGLILMGLSQDLTGSVFWWDDTPAWHTVIETFAPVLILFFPLVYYYANKRHILKSGDKPIIWQRIKSSYISVLIWGFTAINLAFWLYAMMAGSSLWGSPFYGLPFIVLLIGAFKSQPRQAISLLRIIGLLTLFLAILMVNISYFTEHARLPSNQCSLYYFFAGLSPILLLLSEVKLYTRAISLNFRKETRAKETAESRLKELEKRVEMDRLEKQELRLMLVKQQKELRSSTALLTEQANKIIELEAALAAKTETPKAEEPKLDDDYKRQVAFDEFERVFSDDNKCYQYLEQIKWRNEFECKKCGNEKYSSGTGPLARRCTKCGYNETTTTGTLFHRLHFPIQKAFLMAFLIYTKKGNITSQELADRFEIGKNTCWKFSRKVKDAMEKVKERKLSAQQKWEAIMLEDIS
ncbi:7TM-DISM domain-containing protein [Limibacter armeniacum]|uniref:7TM-DISM domain-containing protein n=1 Tax=Limibacter armeniacum TaxID=466084 RepID=UPI002FE55C03